ncbi:peripherin-2-like [Gigantopelta aegis]|uniref:peripherin-2-like n=1 Tax=Gigantopelta aegis TaxID=1735272 RepID=UPI001B88D067|nr:peripherin-2-like [Gigantopelta aegis]
MCIKFRVGQRGRARLGIALGVVNGGLAVFGIIVILVAVYIKVEIEKKMILLGNYNKDPIPYFLISLGCLHFFFHGFAAKVGVDSGDPETSSRFKSILLVFIWTLCALSIVTMSLGILCFAHRSKIRHALDLQLPNVMKLYKSDAFAKTSIDRMQSRYKCCGTHNFKEWFKVSWINDDFLDVDSAETMRYLRHGNFYKDDVPWSCCDPASPRPCVHHSVDDKTAHRHYSEVTLYRQGCAQAMGIYMTDAILIPISIAVFTAYGFELIVLMLFRHLQTSMQSAFDEDDPEGIGDSFLIGSCPCAVEGAKNPTRIIHKKEQRDIEDYKREKKEEKKEKKREKEEEKKRKKKGKSSDSDSESGSDSD